MYTVSLVADSIDVSGSGDTVDGAVESLLHSITARWHTDEAGIAFDPDGVDLILVDMIDGRLRYFRMRMFSEEIVYTWPFHYPTVDDPPMVMTFDVMLVLPHVEHRAEFRLTLERDNESDGEFSDSDASSNASTASP